ncbi:MAG TPA: 16S rRNA (adenine(1518)-N(6)/adenine(1519)-N(6))-dimethyltransferase RsmA [Cyclobacteriaceae bacterium]|jgi:16S rRNA (adenine1518-N6/adenine1519-N6)-dimethyltransferase|nr:16S rRNA (adenine(1518)-N(6)/adenine(1519)-N(6))-dimethyltransferase RsmA [Cytophagales bacterium]HMR56508.1 16S rRNA (adenine(1518)-N(6)/adenine(1519)-N(6))-dimethyltransferase RsmA [Cyclobacteriaceae bacterium]HNT50202.1 16S rRNA (adenine(1518)-N(6)/adenine(1519)-N(6))-dimethyltransferase RsmA [Cyclobacteriaceae bacterium]HRE66324.1 16S rRNA (adenine(1518)-N(6)/adenine(1519)-N(6))-dimethyltransferase RsmA [Cyclobacteriaceae bacterium]HRF32854.1 16S rRNA (adenine(1518)-N(6)/adenine(1519)-N(
MGVRPKKFLGQHFLKDRGVAQRIVEALQLPETNQQVVEIGPGTGVLTQFMVTNPKVDLQLIEIDRESVAYLKENYPSLVNKITEGDFLQLDLKEKYQAPLFIIGNFPYNISSQIFFKILEHRNQVTQVVCMLQKEVADRIAEKPGSKTYGILSVLLQAYYDVTYLFKVPPGVFFPPPKVMSAVIRLTRNNCTQLGCNEELFKVVVKQAFQNRRKTLRNALKILNLPASLMAHPLMDKRAEQLNVEQFVFLTLQLEKHREAN